MKYYNNFAVDVFLLTGEFIGNWPNRTEAARALGIRSPSGINKCLRGQIKHVQGYVWKLHPMPIAMLPQEEWKPIQDYEDCYAVSNKGRVASLSKYSRENFAILTDVGGAHGYRQISLYNPRTKKCKTYLVHRLVAKAFLPNPEQKDQVDHIDTNILNNCVENLRWVTSIENHYNPLTIERHRKAAKDMVARYGNKASVEVKRVAVRHTVGNCIIHYSSFNEAGRQTGHNASVIRKWCNDKKYGWSIENNN